MPKLAFTLSEGTWRPGVCICETEGWGWLSLGVWIGNWIFFCFGYSPDFSRNMLFFHLEILSRHSLETLAVFQEFPSAKQSWPRGQHYLAMLHSWGVGLWLGFFAARVPGPAGCEPQFTLCWETLSWSPSSWGWTLYRTASSNVWVAENTCTGNIRAPRTKRNCLFPFLTKIKWQRHTQLQKGKNPGGSMWSVAPTSVLCC